MLIAWLTLIYIVGAMGTWTLRMMRKHFSGKYDYFAEFTVSIIAGLLWMAYWPLMVRRQRRVRLVEATAS